MVVLQRFVSWFFVIGALAGCATGAAGGDDQTPPDGSGGGDDTGPTTVTGPSFLDSGPPAQVGNTPDSGAGKPSGDGGDEGGQTTPTGCTTEADCNAFATATGVSGVSCASGACAITCNGDNYDVNGVVSDGCEVADICPSNNGTQFCPIDDHTTSTATSLGSYDADDSDSTQDITGLVPSDARVHSPQPAGFDVTSGGAPDYFTILGTGSCGSELICENDANFTIQMSAPTAQTACYVMHLITDKSGDRSCPTGTDGSCSITNQSGSYSDGSTITIYVEKADTCTAAGFPDDAKYEITGHL